MLYSLKDQNMYLKGETFEDNDSNCLSMEWSILLNEIWDVSAQIFSYFHNFALRAGTPSLLTATGFTLVLSEVMWNTRCPGADMHGDKPGWHADNTAGKVPENKDCVNTPEHLPEQGQDEKRRPRYLISLKDDKFQVGVGKREVKFMAINKNTRAS